jgi:hypothetical protein
MTVITADSSSQSICANDDSTSPAQQETAAMRDLDPGHAAYLWAGRSVVRLSLRGNGFRRALFWDILRLGLVAALVSISTNPTIAVSTGLVGAPGSDC